MKTIGMIGGLSWVSTAYYYKIINEYVRMKTDGYHSAKILMESIDLDFIINPMIENNWIEIEKIIIESAKKLQNCGADFILILSNSIHGVAGSVESSINIPLLHIADTVCQEVASKNISRIGLIGTKSTLNDNFYMKKLERYNISIILPNQDDQEMINSIILKELIFNKFTNKSKELYLKVIDKLHSDGAEGVILGCTEIGLLVSQDDSQVKLFDSTIIHSLKAVDFAMQE